MKTKNKNEAITLIALIITIIIMLILAGIVISLTIGENVILTRAKEVAITYKQKAAREKLEILLLDMQADKVVNRAYNENEYLTDKIEKQGMIVNDDVVSVEGWKFQIDRSVPQIIANLGKGELNKVIREDDELARLLKEANMTITVEDILNTPAIMDELRGLIPEIKEMDVERKVIDEVITYKDYRGGIIRTSSEYSNGLYSAWHAFDNSTATATSSEIDMAANYYIEYEFPQSVYAMQIKYIFTSNGSDQGIRKMVVQAYDEEEENWRDLTQELEWRGNSNTKKEDIENLDYTKPYKRYRLYVKTASYVSHPNGGKLSGLFKMQLYGVKTKPETSEELKQLLLSNSNIEKITLTHMITNKEFIKRLINELSIETVSNNEILMANLPSLIPEIKETDVERKVIDEVITYKDYRGGIIRTSSEYSNGLYSAWHAFDNSTATATSSEIDMAANYYIEYEFPQSVYAMQIKYIFTSNGSDQGIRKMVVQAYDEEEENWRDLTQELEWRGNSNTKKEDIENLDYTKPYKRYRLYVKTASYVSHPNGGKLSGLFKMQLYGKIEK